MAIGNAGKGFKTEKVAAKIGNAPIILRGGIHPQYCEENAAAEMRRDEVELTIKLDEKKRRIFPQNLRPHRGLYPHQRRLSQLSKIASKCPKIRLIFVKFW